VDYGADLERVKEIGEKAIARTENVIENTAQVVFRSLWDDEQGHMLAGVLVEGRYRIRDVRDRTRIRSAVLVNVLEDLRAASVPLPAPRIRIEGTGD